MVWLFLCLICGLLFIGSSARPWKDDIYIIGGNTTDILNHPYQVAIWSNGEFRGSGALVDDNWVITTASIVTGFEAVTLSVRCHSTSASTGGTMYYVNKVFMHPKFRFSDMTYDVALLNLLNVRRSEGSKVQLARVPLPLNTTATVSGWGSTSNVTKMSDMLLQAEAMVVGNALCEQVYWPVSTTQFCIKAVDIYGPCWGDSGDLLVYKGKLYGLLSWNLGCYSVPTPSLFTDVSSIRQWAVRTMKWIYIHHSKLYDKYS